MNVIFGTGPLGQSVASALKAKEAEVRLVNRHGHAPVGFSDCEAVAGDLADASSAQQAALGATTIYHCAGAPYTAWSEMMPVMMSGAIQAAASVGARLVYGDNLYAYEPTSQLLTEETLERPKTRKGQVRKQVADSLRATYAQGKVEAVIGRASDFYGPGVFTSAVGNEIFGRLASGKAPRVLGNPDQPHSFTFIEDFGRALVVLAEHGEAFGHTWHVPNAAPASARQFAAKAAEAMGQPMKASRMNRPDFSGGSWV